MNLLTKINILAWYTGQKIKHGTKKIFNLSLNDPKAWDRSLWNLRGSQSQSGETVTEETALTYSAVYNALSLISGTVGSLPLHLMQQTGKTKQVFDKNPLYNVIHTKWNPYVTAMAGRETFMAHILAWGNGYAEKVFNGYGDIVELWPIAPNRVTAVDIRDGKLVYDIRVGNETKTLPREQILHVPGLGFDGFVGYSVIAMARKSIGLGMALETFGELYFGQGTHPGVIVSHPGQLNANAHKNLKKSLTESYSGLGKSHRLMLLEDGMTLDKIGIPPTDSQFIESRTFNITDIARWYNLPVHKLKEMTKSSFNNIESEQMSFVMDSILPWLVRLEQNYVMQLLSPAEQKQNLYFKHIVEGLLRANSKDRALFYKLMIGSGIMTPNEVRSKEDLNPSEDPMADELWMPTGLIPVSKFDEYLAKNTGKQPQPKQIEQKTGNEGVKSKLKLLPHRILDRKKENVDWEKLYKEGNAHWADDMQPSKFAQDFAQELIDKGKKSVLEIGCGGGRDSILFALAGLTVTAIDFVPEAIEIAKENAENAGVKVAFQVGNAENLQFDNKNFDAVFTLSVLHSTNMGKSIPEIRRVLKKNGLSFIYIYSNVEKIDGTKQEFINVNEYIDLLKEHNFKVLDIYTTVEDEFDEAGEKHLIIVSEVQKWKNQPGEKALVDISASRKNANSGLLRAAN